MSNNKDDLGKAELGNDNQDGGSDLHDVVINDHNPVDDEQEEQPSLGKRPLVSPEDFTFWQRRAASVASRPWLYFFASLVLAIILSAIGVIVGNFQVVVDNQGWQSRGTLIGDRQSQSFLVLINRREIKNQGESKWQDLINNIQPGWQSENLSEQRRRLLAMESDESSSIWSKITSSRSIMSAFSSPWSPDQRRRQKKLLQQAGADSTTSQAMMDASKEWARNLQQSNSCDSNFYFNGLFDESTRLWPVWRVLRKPEPVMVNGVETDVVFSSQALQELCESELATVSVLEENGFCVGCASRGQCLPPYSMTTVARLLAGDASFSMSCSQLAQVWEENLPSISSQIMTCVNDIRNLNDSTAGATVSASSCPAGFTALLVDEQFGRTPERSYIQYTSSVFGTGGDVKELYKLLGDFERGGTFVDGAYDTQYEDFVGVTVDSSVFSDMILAMGSAIITAAAILIHTRSWWLTITGLVQIILSFPLAYFVYTFVARLEFFPFLNFIGVFVVFALGADDVFVAVDKWKNARLETDDSATVQQIAAVALPDAAGAMFLTTLTTAIAFFATAICPVAPLKCFAVFCGLLIVFDYIMCVLLVFPALCVYDNWIRNDKSNCCNSCFCNMSCCCKKRPLDEDGKPKISFIRRILNGFYSGLHAIRWPLLVVCIGALIVSAIFATRLELPKNSDVRLLSPSKFQEERNYEWRNLLLGETIARSEGNPGFVIWGTKPADTGNHNNPNSWTQLVLDGTFDPTSMEAQVYLRDFCDRFFAQEFATRVDSSYVCPINQFDQWLQTQSSSDSADFYYSQSCNGASSLPMDPATFHQCAEAWTLSSGSSRILTRNSTVEIMFIRFQQRVRFDSAYNELDSEWKLIEAWMENDRMTLAPEGVNNLYHTSFDFWWYDTNGKMLESAFSAAAIALAAAGAVVLFSSRSIVMTLFALFTIGYVLTSTTAMLVASGWTLGFLESVCFSILIGISCDFVIHFGHAYGHLPGDRPREERTKYALIFMGPSILAAGFTTMAGAAVMLFTVISFFQRFATILFYTIIQATIASFIVFLVLADTLGPRRPTYLADMLLQKCSPQNQNAATAGEASSDNAKKYTKGQDALEA